MVTAGAAAAPLLCHTLDIYSLYMVWCPRSRVSCAVHVASPPRLHSPSCSTRNMLKARSRDQASRVSACVGLNDGGLVVLLYLAVFYVWSLLLGPTPKPKAKQ